LKFVRLALDSIKVQSFRVNSCKVLFAISRLDLVSLNGRMPHYVERILSSSREYQFEEIARVTVAVPGMSDQE